MKFPPELIKFFTRARFNSKLPTMFSFRVQDAKNNDTPALDSVKKLVREPAGEQAAKIAVVKRAAFRIRFQQVNRGANFNQQFVTQPGALRFIPRPRIP